MVQRTERALVERGAAGNRALTRGLRTTIRCIDEDEVYAVEARASVVDWVTSLAATEAATRLVRPQVRAFTERLQRLRIRDPKLRAAADAWRTAVEAPPRSLDVLVDDQNVVIDAGGARLRALGVDLRTARKFGGKLLYDDTAADVAPG